MVQYRMSCNFAEKVVSFLCDIGIPVTVVPGAYGFIRHVKIVDGGLHIDPEAPASGILHEAGHVAIVPNDYRGYMSGDVSSGIEKIFEEVDFIRLDPDSQLSRALLQMGEVEATAWAWAAGQHLGLPHKVIIQDSEYEGDGYNVRLTLSMQSHFGIHGLAQSGYCVVRKNPYKNLPVFPKLAFWLQH